MPNAKCKLLNWTDSEVVAEGRSSSNDLKVLVYHISGPQAMKVWVDVAKKPDAFLGRLSYDMTRIQDAISTTVAWLADKVVIQGL